ncbi:MAG TPA: copper resistance CopC family protein [Steroidobacteraceae bacterium]|nr:copper resistance CopC family protein [Steroidobacteraceae bacterium]
MKIIRTLTATLLTAAPLMAMAHVNLESSTPAKGSTVHASPEKVILVFGETVELKSLSVSKAGSKAAAVLLASPKEAATQFSAPMPKLVDGDYVITYRYIGDDQHDMTSTIRFKISAAAKAGAGQRK